MEAAIVFTAGTKRHREDAIDAIYDIADSDTEVRSVKRVKRVPKTKKRLPSAPVVTKDTTGHSAKVQLGAAPEELLSEAVNKKPVKAPMMESSIPAPNTRSRDRLRQLQTEKKVSFGSGKESGRPLEHKNTAPQRNSMHNTRAAAKSSVSAHESPAKPNGSDADLQDGTNEAPEVQSATSLAVKPKSGRFPIVLTETSAVMEKESKAFHTQEEASEHGFDGASAILEAPGPIRGVLKKRQPSSSSVDDAEDPAGGSVEESSDEDPSEQDERQSSGSVSSIGARTLEAMLAIANHVGHSHDRKTGRWTLEREVKMFSLEAQRVEKRLFKIQSRCRDLQTAQADGDEASAVITKAKLAKLMASLRNEVEKVISGRMAEEDKNRLKRILLDVYFLMPGFIQTIKSRVAISPTPNDQSLEDACELLRLVDALARAAQSQPSGVQPENKGYHVTLPTRRLLPRFRDLQKIFQEALRKRYLGKSHKRRRVETEDSENMSEAAKDDSLQLREAQKEALRRKRANPEFEALMLAHLRRRDAQKAARRRAPRVQHERSQEDESDSNDSSASIRFEQDVSPTGIERVKDVFEKPSKQVRPEPRWTRQEKLCFLQHMREHWRDPGRFAHFQSAVDKPLEEIFEYAKDFQEAMDICHARGEYREPRDEFTWHVWTEQR